MSALAPALEARGSGPVRTTQKYLIVRAADAVLGLPASRIDGMVLMPVVTGVPTRLPEVRGVINLRGQVMRLLDLRVILGMPSYQQEMSEFVGLLDQREQDHINWLRELRASIDEKRPFELARDPHKCKFGKWYDTFVPRNQCVAVMALWRSFNAPHQRIHAIADEVCTLAGGGAHEEARAVIQRVRDTALNDLCRSFAALRKLVTETSREVAVVIRRNNQVLAVSVDEVLATEEFDAADITTLDDATSHSLTRQVALRRNSAHMALLLDWEMLFNRAAAHGA